MKKTIIFIFAVVLVISLFSQITSNLSSFYWHCLGSFVIAGLIIVIKNSAVLFEKIVNLGLLIVAIHLAILISYTINYPVYAGFPWEIIVGGAISSFFSFVGRGIINAEKSPIRDDILF